MDTFLSTISNAQTTQPSTSRPNIPKENKLPDVVENRDPELFYKKRVVITNNTSADVYFIFNTVDYKISKLADFISGELMGPGNFKLSMDDKRLIEYNLDRGKKFILYWDFQRKIYDLYEVQSTTK